MLMFCPLCRVFAPFHVVELYLNLLSDRKRHYRRDCIVLIATFYDSLSVRLEEVLPRQSVAVNTRRFACCILVVSLRNVPLPRPPPFRNFT